MKPRCSCPDLCRHASLSGRCTVRWPAACPHAVWGPPQPLPDVVAWFVWFVVLALCWGACVAGR